jgi:hypothetical protein
MEVKNRKKCGAVAAIRQYSDDSAHWNQAILWVQGARLFWISFGVPSCNRFWRLSELGVSKIGMDLVSEQDFLEFF